MNYRDCLIAFLLINCCSPAFAANREQVASLLQQQSYPEILQIVAEVKEPERDNFLLDAAGYAAYQMSMQEESASYFNASLTKNQSDVQALLYLGLIERQQHAFGAALNHFKQLTIIKPQIGRYYKLAADCYVDLKQLDSALSLLSMGFKVGINDPSRMLIRKPCWIRRSIRFRIQFLLPCAS